MALRNIFIIFLVSGFWHGANWTFVVWGGIHALLYVPLFVFNLNRKNTGGVLAENRLFPTFSELFGVLVTFSMVTLAWVFFRAENVGQAVDYLAGLGRLDLSLPSKYAYGLLLLIPFVAIEYVHRKDERNPLLLKNDWALMAAILICLFAYFKNIETEFIYFQF
jgi:D-alanyl-lipoteichoic acid acyltransferase DltB (MBOAT superfamily)